MGGDHLSVSSASQEQVSPRENTFYTGLHVGLVAFIHRFGGPLWACYPYGGMV